MPYPEMIVAPMRAELARIGFQELRTADQVEAVVDGEDRTLLLVVNSICGCAAGSMRPGVALALENDNRPDVLTTVFAGQDMEATAKAREYIAGYPPSSPSVALFKDGDIVYMMERHQIEGHSAPQIAAELGNAFDEHCA